MRDRRSTLAGVFLAAAVLLVFGASPAAAGERAGPLTVTVTAGKPSEYAFTLSQPSATTGSVVFLVVNRGKVAHSFAIAGQKTPVIAPGRKAKLTILFSQPGSFRYASAMRGQSAKGMRGAFVIRRPPAAPGAPTVTPLQPGDTPVLPGAEACANPVSTTVDVKIFEFGFTLSQTTIPCGTVTFNAKNIGEIAHTFDVEGTSPRGLPAFTGGAILLPGEAETHTVGYTVTGTYKYQCDRHYDQGAMLGQIKVVNG